jgi:hypothetical protein
LAQDAEFYFAYAATFLPEVSEAIRKEMVEAMDSPPYTFFLLNGDMELNRNR